ncbi:MAG: hypothetical protein ACRDF4_08760, partial [Rhabdochlamydiaceae bacterium]
AEGWINVSPNLNGLFAVRGASSSTTTNYLLGGGWSGDASSITYESGTTNNLLSGSGSRSAGWYFDQAVVSGSSLTVNIYTAADGSGALSSTTSTSDSTLGAGNQYVGIATWAGSTSAAYFYGWRIRIDPPNGQLPSPTFGPVTVG